MNLILSSWESRVRSILRIVLSFLFSLHGYRHLLGAFAPPLGRRAVPMALDLLPGVFGLVEIAGVRFSSWDYLPGPQLWS